MTTEGQRLLSLNGRLFSMKTVYSLVLGCFLALQLAAADTSKQTDRVALLYPNTSVDALMHCYAKLTKREVHIAAGVGGSIYLCTDAPIPTAEAIALIRKALLQQVGIEIRDVGNVRADVVWTETPSFIQRKQAPPRSGARRVRVIGEKNAEIDTTKQRIIKPPNEGNR